MLGVLRRFIAIGPDLQAGRTTSTSPGLSAGHPTWAISHGEPFWSSNLQKAARGEGHLRNAQTRGEAKGVNLGGGMPSPSAQDIDRVRERVLKDAEETFAKEVKKLVDGDSASFTSVPSANAGDGQREVPQDPGRHGGGCGPPDSPTGLGGVGGTPGPVKPLMESVTAAFPEARWNLELPPLPAPSRELWDMIIQEVELKYSEWLQATPLARLRMWWRACHPRFQRMEQRMSPGSALLAALPEVVRRDIVASRRVATTAVMYKLFTLYQPGRGAERSNLPRSLTDLKPGTNVQSGCGEGGCAVQKNYGSVCRTPGS